MPQSPPTTLVLLPGLHGTAGLFAPLQRVIPPDVAMRVLSYPTDRACRYTTHYHHIETALAGEDNLVLVAESYSGSLALQFAAAHPDRIRAVILCVSFVSPPVPRVLCYLATIPVMLRVPLLDIGIRTFLSGFRATRETVRELRQEVRKNRPWVLAHRIQQMAWVNGRASLRACRAPVLCIAARRDRLVGARSVRRILRARPDVRVKWLDGPHLLLQVRPAEVWTEIASFLKLESINLATHAPTAAT